MDREQLNWPAGVIAGAPFGSTPRPRTSPPT